MHLPEVIERSFAAWWQRWKRMESVRELSRTAFQAGWEAALKEMEAK